MQTTHRNTQGVAGWKLGKFDDFVRIWTIEICEYIKNYTEWSYKRKVKHQRSLYGPRRPGMHRNWNL